MKFRRLFLTLLLTCIAAASAAAQQSPVTGIINGKIVSVSGCAVRRANVTIMNLTTFETRVRTTNDFGYFHFDDLSISDLYMVTVGSKRFTFALPNQIVQFTATEHNLLFTADN